MDSSTSDTQPQQKRQQPTQQIPKPQSQPANHHNQHQPPLHQHQQSHQIAQQQQPPSSTSQPNSAQAAGISAQAYISMPAHYPYSYERPFSYTPAPSSFGYPPQYAHYTSFVTQPPLPCMVPPQPNVPQQSNKTTTHFSNQAVASGRERKLATLADPVTKEVVPLGPNLPSSKTNASVDSPAQTLLQKVSEDGLNNSKTTDNGQKSGNKETGTTNEVNKKTIQDSSPKKAIDINKKEAKQDSPKENIQETAKDINQLESHNSSIQNSQADDKQQIDNKHEEKAPTPTIIKTENEIHKNIENDIKKVEQIEVTNNDKCDDDNKSDDTTTKSNNNNDDNSNINKENVEQDPSPGTPKLQYDPQQFHPEQNRKGKRVYSRQFLLDVREIICKLSPLYDINDKNGTDSNRLPCSLSENHDFFLPKYGLKHASSNRQNESQRRESPHNYAGRSSAGQEKQRKIIASASLTQEVELKTVSNPWRPAKDTKSENQQNSDDVDFESLKKKFRSILNKLTPDNYDNLSKAVSSLTQIDTETKLSELIDIVFAKAIAEPGYSVLYGKMCRHLKEISAGKANFGNTLLKRCQQQFNADVYVGLDINEYQDKINAEENPELKKQYQEELYEHMFRCRKRSLGLIKFIGELYKIDMLNDGIMLDCVQRLLQDTTEESLECLCDLLTTVGEKLDRSSKANSGKEKKPTKVTSSKNHHATKTLASIVATGNSNALQQQKASVQNNIITLDQTFDRLHKIQKDKDLQLSMRIKFKLLDICELRERDNWNSKKKDDKPKKKKELRAAHEEKLEQERRQQSALVSRRSQDGRRLGHSGASSSHISSLAGESGYGMSNMHTSNSSHHLNDQDHKDHEQGKKILMRYVKNDDKKSDTPSLRPNIFTSTTPLSTSVTTNNTTAANRTAPSTNAELNQHA